MEDAILHNIVRRVYGDGRCEFEDFLFRFPTMLPAKKVGTQTHPQTMGATLVVVERRRSQIVTPMLTSCLTSFIIILLSRQRHLFVDAFAVGKRSRSTTLAMRRHTIFANSSTSSDAAAATVSSITNKMTIVNGLSSPTILDNYDTFLVDMWGVMHDGHAPYDGVLHAVRQLKEAGKALIILSNSSKRIVDSEKMLVKLGFNCNDFHTIITSGEVAHRLLGNNGYCKKWNILDTLIQQNQRKVFVFGSSDDDALYCSSAGWTLSSIEDADLILARGTFTINNGSGTIISKKENEALYWTTVEQSMTIASQRKLPMLISNPDKIRPDPGNKTPMPGTLGDTYERYLWTTNCSPIGDSPGMTEEGARAYVHRIGKPFGEVYDVSLLSLLSASSGEDDDDVLRNSLRKRTIMIGDALETDVVGGNNAGIDVLWVVQNGIHGIDVRTKGVDRTLELFNWDKLCTYAYGEEVSPRYMMDHFRW